MTAALRMSMITFSLQSFVSKSFFFFFFFVNAIPKAKRFLFKAAFFLLLFSWGVGARKGRVLRHHQRISRTFGTNELNLRVPHYLVLLI